MDANEGRRRRRVGIEFEAKVRHELEKNGWWVNKHNNNIDVEKDCFVPAKSNRFMMRQGGFPDFLIFQEAASRKGRPHYMVKFVEVKKSKYLDKDEKEKMRWLVGRGFECFIAYEGEGRKILLRKFME